MRYFVEGEEANENFRDEAGVAAGIQSVCLFPLVADGELLGMIFDGESRSWAREPFDDGRINLLQALVNQIVLLINNARLHRSTQRQMERMAVLNKVAKAISTRIEMDELLELIYQQLSTVIETDTCFVGILDGDLLELRILIDAGQRFAPSKVPLQQGLASHVTRSSKLLLIRNLSEEIEPLPFQAINMGKDRMSESWLGVPLLTGEHNLGI